jgi:hypothetical protein
MKRLGRWFKEFFGAGRLDVLDEDMPFTAEEFGRLIEASVLARKSTGSSSNEKASIR